MSWVPSHAARFPLFLVVVVQSTRLTCQNQPSNHITSIIETEPIWNRFVQKFDIFQDNKLMFRIEQGLLRLLRTKPHRKHQSVVRNSWYCTHLFNSVLSITFLKHVFSTLCCLNGHGPFKTAHLGAKVALGAEVTGTQVCFKSSHLERKVAGGEPKHV